MNVLPIYRRVCTLVTLQNDTKWQPNTAIKTQNLGKTQNWSKTHQQKLAIMCSPMLMDNNIHIRLNVSCLLQSTEHIRLALSDIMIHDVTLYPLYRPLNSRSKKRTLKILISAVVPSGGKEGGAGAILPRKATVITRTLFLKHEDTTKSALYCCGRVGWWLFC